MKTLKDFDFQGKRALVRCDFNVPLSDTGDILDDFRIRKTIPTIEYLEGRGAKIILISHLGRPQKIKDENLKLKKFTLKPVALALEKLMGKRIKFLSDCIGEQVEKEIEQMRAGEVILLENLRFYK